MIQHVLRRRAPLTKLPGSLSHLWLRSFAQGDAAGWAAARRLLLESSPAVAASPEASPSPAPDASQTQIKYEDAPDTAAIVGGILAVREGVGSGVQCGAASAETTALACWAGGAPRLPCGPLPSGPCPCIARGANGLVRPLLVRTPPHQRPDSSIPPPYPSLQAWLGAWRG